MISSISSKHIKENLFGVLIIFIVGLFAIYPTNALSTEQNNGHDEWITIIGDKPVPIKQSPEPFAPVVKTLKPGAQLQTKGLVNGWYEINWKGMKGYVHELFAKKTEEGNVRVLQEEKLRQAKLAEKKRLQARRAAEEKARQEREQARRQSEKEARRERELAKQAAEEKARVAAEKERKRKEKEKKIAYLKNKERQSMRELLYIITRKNLSDRSIGNTPLGQKYMAWEEKVAMEGFGVGAFVGGVNTNMAAGIFMRVLSDRKVKYPSCVATSWGTSSDDTIDKMVKEAMVACRKDCNDCRLIAKRPILSALKDQITDKAERETQSSQSSEPQVLKDLRSGNSQQVRQAAMTIFKRHLAEKAITDAVNKELFKSYSLSADGTMQDAQAWMCKILGTSGEKEYASTLEAVKNGSPSSKVRGYAEKSLRQLR